jgi:hypothetical protein
MDSRSIVNFQTKFLSTFLNSRLEIDAKERKVRGKCAKRLNFGARVFPPAATAYSIPARI